MVRLTTLCILTLLAFPVWAAPVTVQATMPTTNCDGTPITDMGQAELYSDASPIPYDDSYDCSTDNGAGTPPPPAGFTPVQVPGNVGGIVEFQLDLTPGVTYYFRVRVCDVAGNCSPLSGEINHVMPLPVPNRPTVIILGS